jgi:hypothetical protein
MYQLIYSSLNGTVSGIKRNSDGATIPLAEGNSDYQAFLVWNAEQAVPFDLNSISQEMLDLRAAMIARQEAKRQSIIDNLPSWAVVGGKFDSMLTAANAATSLAQAKKVLIDLIATMKKVSRCVYWDIKNTKE